MMANERKIIDRGDYVLIVETIDGQERYTRVPKIGNVEAAYRTRPGGDLRPISDSESLQQAQQQAQQESQPPRPGVIRRVANYGKARVAHALAGNPQSSPATIKKRFATCKKCPSNLYQILPPEKIPAALQHLDEVGTCLDMRCGCFLHDTDTEPAKLAWADSFCPRGHWERAVAS